MFVHYPTYGDMLKLSDVIIHKEPEKELKSQIITIQTDYKKIAKEISDFCLELERYGFSRKDSIQLAESVFTFNSR